MSRCISDLDSWHATICVQTIELIDRQLRALISGRVESHKLRVSALNDSMHVCRLSIDLIRIECFVKKFIIFDISLPIESSQKESLSHSTSC